MLEILKDNVLIAYQQLEQYQLDRYGRGVVSAIDRISYSRLCKQIGKNADVLFVCVT